MICHIRASNPWYHSLDSRQGAFISVWLAPNPEPGAGRRRQVAAILVAPNVAHANKRF